MVRNIRRKAQPVRRREVEVVASEELVEEEDLVELDTPEDPE